ncbi:MAG TPA: ergothioneine biosynthesis protein EgtB [Steroidobacteraceae bacterium]|nr:ergothioneine biosynthesis protein EgtB [Steroidobacteraceae bacterium]
MAAPQPVLVLPETLPAEVLAARYARTRRVTLELCEPLQTEDFVVQSMPDASPTKWHLAHTSWFFEQFLLKPLLPGYRAFHADFEYLFNSYYQSVGRMHERPHRGLLTRPTVKEVLQYREHVDEHMQKLLRARSEDERLLSIAALGVNHEQQHQELMLTDIKHLFSRNPLLPAYRAGGSEPGAAAAPMHFIPFEGGIHEIGATGKHFCFDNELPRHRVLIEPYALADRLVTNSEYVEFIRDGGYKRPEFWLSDGWSTVVREGWTRPIYWSEALDGEFTLHGLQPLHAATPVSHISYYEADAFARWAGGRLPNEAEWELAAESLPAIGNLLNTGELHPTAAGVQPGMKQMFGDVWEWTASPYSAYPGYQPPSGALSEYNGKFMCNQLVLRGGSCATPADHIRASYRNFFYADARWQFMGVRLARNL